MHNDRNERGFTLVEWLIGFGIGLFLLTIVCRLYLETHKITYFISGAQEIRSNERMAFGVLAYDIRMAGFIGCPNFSEVVLPKSPYLLPYNIIGINEKGYVDQVPSFPKGASDESDVLYLQYADPEPIPIIKAQGNSIQFESHSSFPPNTVLLISDCRHAEVFKTQQMHLKFKYSKDAIVRRFYHIIYYVARTKRTDKTQQPVYALYRQDLNSKEQPAELVENITKLKMHYGIPNNTGCLDYVTADQVPNWKYVRNLTVTLQTKSREKTAHEQINTAQQTIMIRSQAMHCLK